MAVSNEIYERMKEYPEIRWSEVARKAIEERLALLDALNAIASKSKLTEKDVEELAEKVKHGIAKKHGLVK